MMHRLLLLLFWLLPVISIYGQKATVTFASDKDCEVFVYKPLDGGYNEKALATRLVMIHNQPATYETEVSSFMFLYCQFPQYQKSCNVLLFPNDSIEVHLSADEIVFKGSNETGQQYLYDNFKKYPDLENYLKIQDVFNEYLENKRELCTVIPTVDERRGISKHIKAVEDLPHSTNTTSECARILQTEVWLYMNSDILDFFKYLLSEDQKKKSIPTQDSIRIKQQTDSIFRILPVSPSLIRYPSKTIYLSRYLDHYYSDKELPKKYDSATFGPYKDYLYTPQKLQPALLGNAVMVQLKFNSGEMNLVKVKKFFNEEFPQSEYTAVINELVKDEEDTQEDAKLNKEFIKEKIDSLSQLTEVQALKGKFLYIDLWASWCMPCRGEFSYKDKVEELLDTHKNIVPVYISIDNEKQEKAWTNCINHYKLEGFHLRASAELQKNIQEMVYGSDRFDIPRYVLIGPDGKIIHKDLPRPSNYPELKKIIDEVMQ
ncbi:TlpA family protein disulfide reductase [Bacteroides oleiciplenus]|uniref:Thioredoxin domain-containing protein n=1 Tax=Bacteroides oleiciplenus TaxID=626931 RepID=A0A3E5B9S2_9BACE|nr:redoxin family protein [Bacteroides oleiciplenus]RGN34306.1 hypothetical protein DXB65_14575 [Bacteroides oleiciplenus]